MNTIQLLHRTLTASAVALLTLAGCQSARMPVPETLASNESLPVVRGTSAAEPILRIGAYETHSHWRIETEAPRPTGNPSEALTSEAERYGFTLRLGSTDLWDASCSTPSHPAGENVNRVACTITAKGNSRDTWALVLKPYEDGRMMGMIQQGEETYQVLGTNQTEGGIDAWDQTGYVIGALGQSVAAVDFSGAGRVWLPTSDDVRLTTLMTTVSAALLVTEDVRTT